MVPHIYIYILSFSRGWNWQEKMPWRCLWVDLQPMCNLADLHIIPVSKRHIPPSVGNWVGVQWTLGISIRSGVSPPQPLMMNPMQSKMRPSQWLDLPAALQIEGCHPYLSWLPYLWSQCSDNDFQDAQIRVLAVPAGQYFLVSGWSLAFAKRSSKDKLSLRYFCMMMRIRARVGTSVPFVTEIPRLLCPSFFTSESSVGSTKSESRWCSAQECHDYADSGLSPGSP